MNGPLSGRTIIVTRPLAQTSELARLITERGGKAVLFPLIEIGPPDSSEELEQAVERIGSYALAVFISPNAVDFAVPAILADQSWPSGLRAAAIGPGTVAALARHCICDTLVPSERFDSEALLALPGLQQPSVSGKRIVIFRGNGGRELLADTLRERGATVDQVGCYRRLAPRTAAPLELLWRDHRLDALTVSSSEGLRNLLSLLDQPAQARLRATPVFVPHQRIAEQAEGLGLRRVVLTGPADAGIIAALCGFAWPSQ
ncbi:uroporphyrinogen-III synthase [Accumulibacter sp.]|uniref:uroporphyrinogen-III synthase n=1 Tax=Accumulibacter sp. TaxID=2053492 RepID=UPI0025F36B21|nr:uroporphyrinogen-III synthase [Accumulibacter sp.]MCM8594144.1 uroporphyrinogen-III synthase [Accumulibacter sp.]MCM8625706.1 uroporphyrinogen-III synthase [Accumulibacter sp.]MDS4048287.1 uroporphyrinogen-III synthase [Accumulibacter sp.]